jgi:hypothetical protein
VRLLAYCITEDAAVMGAPVNFPELSEVFFPEAPSPGMRHITEPGLRCWYCESPLEPGADQGAIADAAMRFHRVLQRIFSQTAVVPFRFPTFFDGTAEISNLLRERAAEYKFALARLRNKSQLDVQLTFHQPLAKPADSMLSGKAYLGAKQERSRQLDEAKRSLREICKPWVEMWSERATPTGLRCYALVPREAERQVLNNMAGAQIPATVRARVTGPWPPGEFVELQESHAE